MTEGRQDWHKRLDQVREQLRSADRPFVTALMHGTMSVELFAPRGADTQSPHRQDELYIVSRGTATFLRDTDSTRCKAGDVLFVPAGMVHRFAEFSDDFETWVIFWGPDGGEKDHARSG